MPFALRRHAAPSLSLSSCALSSLQSLLVVSPRSSTSPPPALLTAALHCRIRSPPQLLAAAPRLARRRYRSSLPLLAAITAPRPARRRSAPPQHWQLLAADLRRCKGLPPLLATAPSACCIYGCKSLHHPLCALRSMLMPGKGLSLPRPWGQATKTMYWFCLQ